MSGRMRRRLLNLSRSKKPAQAKKTDSVFGRLTSGVSKTALAGAAISVVAIANTLWDAHDKFVVLPFEVKGDKDSISKVGDSISVGITRAIDELNYIYKSNFSESIDKRPQFELIPSYLSQIPLSSIPRPISISEATTLSRLNLFGIDVPIGELIFNHLAFLHKNYISGVIEMWGDENIVSVKLGNGETFILTAGKDKNFTWIIDMISAEVLNREHWLNLPPTKSPSLMYFTRGLSDYIKFTQYGDRGLLDSAKQNYKRAIEIDPSFSLARLHLAVTEYNSWSKTDLLASIANFSALSGNPELYLKAKIGLGAALTRHMERNRDCETYDRDLDRASTIVKSLSDDAQVVAESVLLKAIVERKNIDRILNNSECREPESRSISNDVNKTKSIFNGIIVDCDKVLGLIKERESNDYRFISVLLVKKYALEDLADFLISKNMLQDALATLYSAKGVSKAIQDGIDSMPTWQAGLSFPYVKGSFAETDLKLAYVNNRLAETNDEELKDAERDLRELEYEQESGDASRWAIGRIAELLFSEERIDEVVDSLSEYVSLDQGNDKEVSYFDENSVKYSAIIEKPDAMCGLVNGLKDIVKFDQRSVLAQIILADMYLRHGDTVVAKKFLQSGKFSYLNNYLWYGPPVQQAFDLLDIELTAEEGRSEQALQKFEQYSNYNPKDPTNYKAWLETLPNYRFVNVLRAVRLLSKDSSFQDAYNLAKSSRPELGQLVAAEVDAGSLLCLN
jgi:hypothetical protein